MIVHKTYIEKRTGTHSERFPRGGMTAILYTLSNGEHYSGTWISIGGKEIFFASNASKGKEFCSVYDAEVWLNRL